ncbi:MAG: STM4011 family radical SAM protein [Planctomycetota bacterium]
MSAALTLLYRGALVSCNYACAYCPFAKRQETRAEQERDRAQLERFVAWVEGQGAHRLSLLFTPWGEALVRPWYRAALARLSRLAHVERVAIQTNLSVDPRWTEAADLGTLALWATFHPGQTSRARFLARCRELDRRGVRYSVGIVGLREHLAEAEALRAELDPGVYLWVNAYERDPDYYRPDEVQRLERLDPLFRLNLVRHPSRGLPCRAGHEALAVDREGALRRCHFIPEVLGDLYAPGDLERALRLRACTNETCGCYIGYLHLEPLDLYRVYAGGVLERIPAEPVWRRALPLAR